MRRNGLRLLSTALGFTYAAAAAVDQTNPTSAVRGANPDFLSGGVFAGLDAVGAFGTAPVTHAVRAGVADLSKGKPQEVLDPRVGPNVRLGDDPAPLPLNQSSQAEPHLYRSSANPDHLLATFQEGRYNNAGSINCGYAVSLDGGFTWRRALVPNLAASSGGPYNRATDPVAAIGPQGDFYLNNLGSISGVFDLAAVVVSRSTDQGMTWSSPVVVYQSPSAQVFPDKNWMAVNDYAGSTNAGRLVVTWTNFVSNASGQTLGLNLMGAVSDDRGVTWSAPIAISPDNSMHQGSLPVFHPDGSLSLVYIRFATSTATTAFSIECRHSADGGRTYAAMTPVAANVIGWDDPDLRDGVFLPSVAVARQSGSLFVAYTAVVDNVPRVLVTRSADKGTSWSFPTIASDNGSGISVMNPAIVTTPDGATVSVLYTQKRAATGDTRYLVDHYVTTSFDGGATWTPAVRVNTLPSDVRHAALTSRGYMLGDYLGFAPPPDALHAAVAIWCDTRTGDSDPFTARFAPRAVGDLGSWYVANGVETAAIDWDNDGFPNTAEFALGMSPRDRDSGETFVLRRSNPGTVDVAWVERIQHGGATVLAAFGTQPPGTSGPVPEPLPGSELPVTSVPPGLRWVGARYSIPAGDSGFFAHYAPALASADPLGHRASIGTNSRLINVSTRASLAGTTDQLIVGTAVDGTKSILVRAAGPSLSVFGLPEYLPDPLLTFGANVAGATAVSNSRWQQGTADSALFARLSAFPFLEQSDDAAVLQTVTAGVYTGVVRSSGGRSGTVLLEAYDADASPGLPGGARITNLSTRGNVGPTPATALIAGFVIGGTESRRVLVRGVGPGLAVFGVGGFLVDPILTLTGAFGVVATNDDWQVSASYPAIAATGSRLAAFPLAETSHDAAILITLPPGAYTAAVSGVNGATGNALVEVYDAD